MILFYVIGSVNSLIYHLVNMGFIWTIMLSWYYAACIRRKNRSGGCRNSSGEENAPRLHVQSRRGMIVVSGEAVDQIQLGLPAVPGRFDLCDLPPKCLFWRSPTLIILSIQIFSPFNIQSASGIPGSRFCDAGSHRAAEESACRFFCPRTHPRDMRASMCRVYLQAFAPAGSQPTVSPLRWRALLYTLHNTLFYTTILFLLTAYKRKTDHINFINNQTAICD